MDKPILNAQVGHYWTRKGVVIGCELTAKSSFLANMSHELRTPLNAILGFSEMMRDGLAGPPSAKWQDYAASVNDAGSHLLALIDEILDLSKIEAGRVTLEVERVDLPRLFQTCTEIISPMMARAQVAFETACAPSVSVIQADPIRLKQFILNLLSNAAKFTLPAGRIELSAIAGEDGAVEIRVADTGIGMTPQQVSKALEVFGQIDSEVARRHRGSGLGLPIAAGLTELHGGRFVVDSALGIGTTVTIVLPRASLTVAGFRPLWRNHVYRRYARLGRIQPFIQPATAPVRGS